MSIVTKKTLAASAAVMALLGGAAFNAHAQTTTVNFETGTNDGVIGTSIAGFRFFTTTFGQLNGQSSVSFGTLTQHSSFFEQLGQQSGETLYVGSGSIPPYGFNYTSLDDLAASPNTSNTLADKMSTAGSSASRDGLTEVERVARVGSYFARNNSFSRDSHVIQNTTTTPWTSATLDIIDIDGNPNAGQGGEQFTVDAYLGGALQFSALTAFVGAGQSCTGPALCGNKDSTSYDGQIFNVSLAQSGTTFDTIVIRFAGASGNALKTTDTVGIVFDNLVVTAIPEPETYAMILAGLALTGFMTRRRQQAAV